MNFLNYFINLLEQYNFDGEVIENEHPDSFFSEHQPSHESTKDDDSLYYYTEDSKTINRNLWKGEKHDMHDKISNVLKSGRPAKKDFHVFTGVNANKNELKGNLHIPAFTSTSTRVSEAADFTPVKGSRHTTEKHVNDGVEKEYNIHHIIKIHVKKGQQVGAYISDFSQFPKEREFLINKGHTLHLSGEHEDHHMPPYREGLNPRIYRIHHATITMDDEK